MKIRDIELPYNVILAPMSGVTDLPFRMLVRKFGIGLVVSEMVASRAMIMESKKSLRKSDIIPDDPTAACVQLAGCEPEVMRDAAKLNEDMGAKIIDINFGCPAKKIVNNYSGSALMRDEILASKIIEATVNAVKVPVTLKMRTGWDDNTKNAPKLAKIAEDLGVQMITIHGRTRCQFYTGRSDWAFVKNVKDSVNVPVVVNGDITSIEDAVKALKQSGADGVMIGRGAYGKPWLPKQIAHYLKTGEILQEPGIEEQFPIIKEHYESMLEYYGIEAGMRMARKHLCWYSANLHNAGSFRDNINKCSDINEARMIIDEFFSTATVRNVNSSKDEEGLKVA